MIGEQFESSYAKAGKVKVRKRHGTTNVLELQTFDENSRPDDMSPSIRNHRPGDKRREFARNLAPLQIVSTGPYDFIENESEAKV